MASRVHQDPAPGNAVLCHRGDGVTVSLQTPPGGTAWLRTNAPAAAIRRQEVIEAVELGYPRPGQDWQDLPMEPLGDGRWSCRLALEDIGCYEAKAYWLPEGSDTPLWPDGSAGNLRLKVQPAWTASGCSIYSAFTRMFQPPLPAEPAGVAELDAVGWTVIPPSGTFRALAAEVPRIIDEMGFRVVMLLPPFSVPTTHARMGRFGSPFAALDYQTVDPACAEHDGKTTPLEQFQELGDAIHSRGGRLFIDVPINHTGWASRLMQLHPEWYKRDGDGEFHSPGAWGVVWADLVELDFTHRDLWREMAGVFLYWCRQGVDGFRCDAGYMVPVPVWEYITAKVREEYPDTLFLLEGLGGPVATTLELLTTGGLDWAYSELFQNEDRGAIDWYLPQAIAHSATHGLHVHFAETHDNNRLAAKGAVWARMRIALCALASPNGGWGLTCGAEWLAAEKVHVHGASPLNTGAEPNLIAGIAALNRLLATHPAFRSGSTLDLITQGEGPGIALRRLPAAGGQSVLVVANLNPQAPAIVRWKAPDFAAARPGLCLWTGQALTVREKDGFCALDLPAGAVFCLPSPDPIAGLPSKTPISLENAVIVTLPRDERRTIVWPPEEDLVVVALVPFSAELRDRNTVASSAHSSPSPEGTNHLVRVPFVRAGTLHVRLHQEGGITRLDVPLHQPGEEMALHSSLTGAEVRALPDLHVLLTNGTGAMTHTRAAWGTLRTQYDCLLAANPDPLVPVDRRILLSRCRAWIVRRGFSTELTAAWTTAVCLLSSGHAAWSFHLPCGDGHWIDLTMTTHLVAGEDRVLLHFERQDDGTEPVMLILRPDIEDRGFHEKTVLTGEAPGIMSAATAAGPSGFRQPCHNGGLYVSMEGADFVVQPEFKNVSHPLDARRGLGGSSDLYSPGYFETKLAARATAVLSASLIPHGQEATAPVPPLPVTHAHTLKTALMQFVVRRDGGKTIIAGYPWFLDWGRDTLIVLRGLVAAGEHGTVRDTLRTFAGFEENGTLPNMIRGNDCSNRSTSDAPLWFCVATADLLAAEQSDAFLDERAGGRTIREVIRSIASHYISGTPNGIHIDPASGLIWSPSHYTWMDTNYPAGTPREGYPLDIQALWHGTLRLLGRIDPGGQWPALAAKVRDSIATLYNRKTPEFLSDCLHGPSGTPAASAEADDHLRPNQLLAITLGAVTDSALAGRIIASSMELLVPGAIRTLADRSVTFELPVYRDGHLLNNPRAPFWPTYQGDEDTRRKPAYHNGTAWPWPMPALPEAILLTGGSPARARAILASMIPLSSTFCLGHLPEIVDAGIPHTPGGCGAQAWSVSELLRVEKLLHSSPSP